MGNDEGHFNVFINCERQGHKALYSLLVSYHVIPLKSPLIFTMAVFLSSLHPLLLPPPPPPPNNGRLTGQVTVVHNKDADDG